MSAKSSSRANRSETIASHQNQWIRRFRAALENAGFRPGDAVAVEGVRGVAEALRSGLRVIALLVSESGEHRWKNLRTLAGPALEAALNSGTRLFRTSDRIFRGISATENPQGMAALVVPREWQMADLLNAARTLVVVLVEIQDPGNVGTIIRSAEALSATGVIALRGTAAPFAPKALRASAGAALRVPMLLGASSAITMAQLRMAKIQLLAATTSMGPPAHTLDLRGPIALFIGNEGAGLPQEIMSSADGALRIPLRPDVDSLNASVAAGILLYEIDRQRRAV